MAAGRGASAASRVFLAFLGAVVVITALLAVLLTVDAQSAERAEAEQLTLSLARTISVMPTVTDAMSEPDAAATAVLEPVALEIIATTPLDFVTIMRPDGIRITHPDPAQIGKPYLGTIEAAAQGGTITEEFSGTLGPSVRSVVPIQQDGEVIGLVSAGVTVAGVWTQVWGRLPFVVGVAVALAAVGAAAAWFAGGSRARSRVTCRPARSGTRSRRTSRCAHSARRCARRRTSTATGCTPPWPCSSSAAPTRRSAS